MRLDNEIEEFDQYRKKIISSTEIYLSKSQENSISFSRMGIDYYVLIWRKRRGEDWIRSQEFNKTSVDRYRKNIKYTKTSAGNRLEKKRIMDREQFIYSFLSNPGRRKNTVRLSTSRKWRRAKLPDPGDGPRPFRVSKATSCFSRPLSHLCLSNPASRSIVAFDGAPILPELRWKRPPPPPLPLADLSSLFVDSVYTRAHPLYFPPLPSPLGSRANESTIA